MLFRSAAPARAPRAAAAAAATAPPSPGPAQPGPRAQRAAPLAAPPPAPAAPPAVAPPAGPRRAPPPAVAAREPPLPPAPQPQQQPPPPPPQPQQPPEGGAARAGGPARPVSLREVVRYLGGSGGAGGRLTRGRVQGLLEEEAAARGRLERTRLGALALPRGDRPGRVPPAASARASRSKVSAPRRGAPCDGQVLAKLVAGRESQEEAGRGRPGLCASSLRARRVVTLASDLIFASLSFLRCKTRLNNSSDLLGLLSEFSEIWLLRALLTQSLARSGCVKVSPCWY